MRDKEYKAIQGDNLKSVLKMATELRVQKEDIIQIVELKGVIYLVYQA